MNLQIALSQDSQSDKWSTRLAFFIALYAIAALLLRPSSFATLAEVYASKFIASTPILLIGGLGTMALLFGRDAPTRYAVSVLKERWRTLATVMAFFFTGLTAFSTFKSTIPFIVPYYADIWLADLDEWLHGAPSWELVHRFDNQMWSLIVLKCYEVLWFVQWFGTVLFVSLWSNRVGRIRYLWAHALTIFTIGTVLAVALSSVGPIYYDHFVEGDRFHGLKVAMDGLGHSEYANYLLDLYEAGQTGLGSGISAMPSVHVGLVVLNALFLSSLNRWLGVVGWAFAAMIFYGSVYTGWHYAVDGYVATAVALAIWWLTGRLIHQKPHSP
ncbi:phosphatase PAP2 family protein [Rhizobium mongolense]